MNEDPGEDVALLSVSFEDAEATQVFPKLYLSPRIEQWVRQFFSGVFILFHHWTFQFFPDICWLRDNILLL